MKAYIVGVGMTRFEKPETRDWQYWDMVREAGTAALDDAGVRYDQVEQVPVGYCFQASTAGQRAVYELGLTGVPVYNVNNNCATGSTALMLARQFVEGGGSDCVLAVGFEKMARGALGGGSDGGDFATSPVARHYGIMAALPRLRERPAHRPDLRQRGPRAHGAVRDDARAARGGRGQEPPALGEQPVRPVPGPVHGRGDPRRPHRPPPPHQAPVLAHLGRGGGRRRRLRAVRRAARTGGAGRGDRRPGHDHRHRGLLRLRQLRRRGRRPDVQGRRPAGLHGPCGLGPDDLDVIELHDCFSINELLTYEALGLCGEGESGKLVESGATTYGGRWVVNPSGGLISKGHPLGATGIAQAAELTWQLRGEAGARQVPGARTALAHNIGLGGAAVVTLLRRG